MIINQQSEHSNGWEAQAKGLVLEVILIKYLSFSVKRVDKVD